MEEKTRYSDEELEFFRQHILKKLAEARETYEQYRKMLAREDDNSDADTAPTFHGLDDGYIEESREEIARTVARLQRFIRDLERALIRIENKTYGICRATGKLISKERLLAVPHTTLSYEAKVKGLG